MGKRRFKPPVYLFERTEEEIAVFYEDSEIVKYRWEELNRNINSYHTPFGYKQSADPDLLEPIPFELDVLEHAKKLLELRDTNPAYQQVYSLRKLAYWVTSVTGREISHQGLKTRINDDYERRKREEEEIYKKVQEEVRRKASYVNSDTQTSITKRVTRASKS